MDVVSTCPLRVSSVTWQPWPGVWAFTVVCKATFRLDPGAARLAEVQEAPAESDVHYENDTTRSLFAPSDLVPFKARADVVLVGHAFAPRRQPARLVIARLAVGEVDKRIEVWCDRIFWHQGQVLEGTPFVKMPLRYERAAGGPENPVGMRFDAPPDAHGAVPIPNLQPMGIGELRRGDIFAPVGFGPISPSFPERITKLPRSAAGWSPQAWREQALPKNFDQAYFNAAPRDQQLASIRPDERIALENLHPDHERLETRLPGIRPRAAVTGGGRIAEDVPLTCDTLWIDTDRGIATVVWRGRVALTNPQEAGQVVVSMEGPGIAAASVARRPDSTAELGGNTAPLSIEGDPDSATLAIEPDPIDDVSDESSTIAGAVPGSPSLPFGPAKSPWAAFPQKASKSAVPLPPEDTGTAIEARAPLREVLPFGGNEKPVVRPPAPPLPGEPPRILLVDAPAQVIHEPRTAKLSEPEAPAPHAAEPPDKTAPAELAPLSDGLPLAEYPLERCAAIGASIARSKEDKSRILEANKLDAAAWAALDQHWNEAVLEETRRGKAALLWAYDAAYVARLEEERGPIRLEEYARISVAAERGALGDVLPEMSLPREAIMRIERVWLKKIAGDGTLGRSARRAVKTAREA